MTGPEHYREAVRLLADAEHTRVYGEGETVAANHVARAQVHATLALAAATAILPERANDGGGFKDYMDWYKVAGGSQPS